MIAHTATAVCVLGYGSRQDGGLLQLQLKIENASGERAHLRCCEHVIGAPTVRPNLKGAVLEVKTKFWLS